MDDNSKMTDQTSSVDSVVNPDPHSYKFLLSMSKRLGRVATKSFVEVKAFLQQEITMSQTERFIAGMPRIKLNKHIKSSYDAKESPKRNKNLRNTRVSSAQDLKRIIRQSHEILATANTVFPITLFPDTVFVDRTKVTIIRRNFFWSTETMSIRIEDLLNVSATIGPLFGSLTIASRVMSTIDHFQINHLWRSDTIHLKHVIQGYVIAQHNKIDVAHLSKDELVKTLVEIGHDSNQ